MSDGGTLADAQASLDAVSARLEAAYPETNDGWYAIAQPLQSVFVGSIRPALLMLFAAIAFVLLIACENVANLLLARAVGRRGEVAVRSAMGASRGRIVRQLMTERLILASAGGVLGVLVAKLGVLGLMRIQPGNIPRMDEVALDGTVLAFSAGVSIFVGLVFGIVPAFGLASKHVVSGLRSAGRDRLGGSGRLRSVLISGEVALSFVLVTGAILLTRSFSELRSVDPGFDPEGVVALSLSFPEGDVPELEAVTVALDRVVDRVSSQPGVERVGAATVLPFSGVGGDTYVYAEERPPEQIRNIQNTAFIRFVDEGYFAALRYSVARGRVFTRSDDRGTEPRVVINEALQRFLFPEEDPLGKRMVVAIDSMTAVVVIGVVKDARQFNLGTPAQTEFFLSTRQYPQRGVRLVVRGSDGVPPRLDELRSAIWEVDASQPLTRTSDLEQMVGGSLAPGRFQALLLGLFSVLAVGLAAVGVYSILAEGVNERRREIGVRMAMGAQPSSVVQEVVRRGVKLAVAGCAVGALVAFGVTRLLATFLFGVGPLDPVAFLLTPLCLVAVVALASWIPAHQAARVDPATALRDER